MTLAHPLVGTVLDGKFRIDKALASGVAGDVYEALHLGLSARVAVKILRDSIPETIEIRRRRFVREARVAANMQSEHVVRVFDIVANEGSPAYIVMELLQGETLGDRIRRIGSLPIEVAVDYVLQAVKPLAEMHDAGIIHRDVKPSNLFVAKAADGKERIKLLDFGVAALTQAVAPGDSSLTLSEAIVGTPRYMAPEQVRGPRNVDARADVWALGVTLYEMLAGKPPFDGKNVLAVLNQIERQEAAPLTSLRPDVPAEIAAVVHACLAKSADARPSDARALGAALVAARDHAARVADDATAELNTDIDAPNAHDPKRVSRTVAASVTGIAIAGALVAIFLSMRGTTITIGPSVETLGSAPSPSIDRATSEAAPSAARGPIPSASASVAVPAAADAAIPASAMGPSATATRVTPSVRRSAAPLRPAPTTTAASHPSKPARTPTTRDDDDDRLE